MNKRKTEHLLVCLGVAATTMTAHADPSDVAVRNAPMCPHAFEFAGAIAVVTIDGDQV